MRDTLKILHTIKTKTHNIVPDHHIPPPPPPPPNKISSVPTGKIKKKNIEGKGTPLNITAVEVVVAGEKPGAEQAGSAWTAAAVE